MTTYTLESGALEVKIDGRVTGEAIAAFARALSEALDGATLF